MTRTFIMNEEVREILFQYGGRMNEVKPFITAENANYYDNTCGETLIWLCCFCQPDDDPDLVQYFADLGAPVVLPGFWHYTCLSVAAFREKPKTICKLLDLGHPINIRNKNGLTALEQIAHSSYRPFIASILLDFGGKCDADSSDWFQVLCAFRDSVRSSAISTMGAMRTKYGKDVSRIIGRCVWNLRGIYE